MVMKQQYEDEIVRLRRQLDSHPLKGDPDSRGGVSAAGFLSCPNRCDRVGRAGESATHTAVVDVQARL